MGQRQFVHLHVHSQYSLLAGALTLPKLMKRLEEFGASAVAVTDYGNMFGTVDVFKRAKKAGLKPIIGLEAYVAHTSRFEKDRTADTVVLLAKNAVGYRNLRILASRAYLDGLDHVPRIDLELLAAHNEGLIGLSAGHESRISQALEGGRMDQAEALAQAYADALEPGAFYLEVVPSGLLSDATVHAGLRALSDRLDLPLVAGGNVHYLDRRTARAHDVLMCIEQGTTLDNPRRRHFETDGLWLKTAEQMWDELGEGFADALENTVKIAAQCDLEIELGKIHLPDFPVPDGFDIGSYLVHCTHEGMATRYAEFAVVGKQVDQAVYTARLEEELGIIKAMEFPGYFMIVQDFINWAKKQDIPVGPGRGSGAGSLVAYALRITDLDPIPYGLLFERFLNPERVSMPDFDIDFCMNRRGEVIEYVTDKYGKDQVGQIATFGSLKARGVIKDVGRVLGLSFGDRDRISKLVPDVLGITLDEALKQEPKLRDMCSEDPKLADLFEIARSLEGLLKSPGMHAAGVVIGEHPLWEYCPVFTGANGELVTQFAKDEVEDAGLVKFDFLGLKTLTVIDDAVRMINRHRKPADRLDMTTLQLDNPAVYQLISRGDTEGVFQLESGGFTEMLKKLKPDCFEDIVAAVALYRPGPMGSGMHLDFIARKHGRQRISYPHPCLTEILKDTYGVIVYQEQVMQIAQVMAGFTLGGADILRRAMGKKKAEVMAQQRELFAAGAQKNGIDPKIATDVFDLMETFAQYGFNKSHSAAYALLTYQTGYLKAHHKVAFMASVLTNDKDNADKVAKGIRNAQNFGIEVLPPDVNRSLADFDEVDGRILFGMAGVKGVGSMAVEAMIEARRDGRFTSLFDFCDRVDLRRVNKKTIEALIKTGAFDFGGPAGGGHPRARLCAALDAAVERAQNAQRDRASGQANLFGMLSGTGTEDKDSLPSEYLGVGEWNERELLGHEKDALGFYVSGHPLDRFVDQIKRYSTATIEELPRRKNFDLVKLAGIQTSIKIRPFKNRDGRMAIILFEDRTGSVELVAMGDEFDRYEALLTSDEPLLVTATLRVDREDGQTNVSARLGRGRRRNQEAGPEDDEPLVKSLAQERADRSNSVTLRLPTEALHNGQLAALKQALANPLLRGECTTRLVLDTDDNCVVTLGLPGVFLAPSDELNDAMQRLFGDACAVVYK